MDGATPIILCGKSPVMATEFTNEMKPEYNVVAVFLSREAAEAELLSVASGRAGKPSSGIGSNNDGSDNHFRPRAVVLAKGFWEEVPTDWLKSLPGGDQVAWLEPDIRDYPGPGDGSPVHRVALRVKRALAANGFAPGSKASPSEGGTSFTY